MIQATVLLLISVISQTIGCLYLKREISEKAITNQLSKKGKMGFCYVIIGLIIQVVIVVMQVMIMFLFSK